MYLNLIKIILILEFKKLGSYIALVLGTFLNLNKFSDLDLSKF